MGYNLEQYWSEVGKRIKERKHGGYIAGDIEPFYLYKRKMFLQLLTTMPIEDQNILEVGCGPGGNLKEILRLKPKSLTAVDVSQEMVDLARHNHPQVQIILSDGINLPFPDKKFDRTFTATVLQHNTDEKTLKSLIGEICRVTEKEIYIFERTERKVKGNQTNTGRPISYYTTLFKENGFQLEKSKFLNIRISYLCCGTIRKVFNPGIREEGETPTKVSVLLQNAVLPFTKLLDPIFKAKSGLTMMAFKRNNSQ